VKAVAYVVDLMDRSKVLAAGQAAGIEIRAVRSGQAAMDASVDADVVVVDLSRPDALDVIADLAGRVRVVAYGAHVDTERLERARRAGAEAALARSAFFAEPARWIS
jgi:DNA-binding NarL/FixJ family response regulator